MYKVIRVDFEEPIVDGSIADVYEGGKEVGSMIYNQDLDQWNDTALPGDVADKDPLICATNMVKIREAMREVLRELIEE